MEKKVLVFIREQNMLQKNDRVLVGISGGADSVCLLFLLEKLKNLLGIELFAVHVNHCLRGAEADEDEAFSMQFCEKRNISFEAVRVDVKKRSEEEKLSLEEAGRLFRYEIFEQKAKQWNCNKIAVAHHGDDCAETVLFQMFRGSGLKGLAGIAPVRQQIIRPLLCIERAEIEQYLNENQVEYRTDSTNLCNDYTRNKIRNQLLPFVKSEINEEAVSHILQLAETARKADAYFEKKALELMKIYVEKKQNCLQLSLAVFAEDRIVTGYVLRACIQTMTKSLKDITKNHIEDIYNLCEKPAGKYINLPDGLCVKRQENSIEFRFAETAESDSELTGLEETGQQRFLSHDTEPVVIGKEQLKRADGIVIFEKMGYKIQLRCFVHKKNKKFPQKTYTKWFDYDTISDIFCLRTRLTGDFFTIDESGKRKKLQRYFIDEKVPKDERDNVLLLADSHEIIWAVGHRISESYKVKEDTKTILEVQITEDK